MKFLVVRTDRIGDVIASTPVFESLRRAFPSAHISALVRPYTKDLLINNPNIDEVIVDDSEGEHKGIRGFFKLAGLIREKKFNTVITLYSRFRIGLILFLAGIPKRVAPATKIAQIFYNVRVRQRRSQSVKHEADYNLDLLASVGVQDIIRKTGLWTSEASDEHADEYLINRGLFEAGRNGKLVGVHPGSGGSALNWSPERYAELAEKLISEHGYSVIITGGMNEEKLVDELAGKMVQKPAQYLSGDILDFASILKKMTVFVSSSTGPMHMAAALGIPTVSLFCPIRPCTPVRWGPIGNRQRILTPEVPECHKCTGADCEFFDCMEMITVDSAVKAVIDMAENK